jgi:malate dehydrogenase
MAGEAAGPRCLRKEGLGGANKILPCVVYLNGKYDMKGLFVGVPVTLGQGRIEQVVGIKFTPEEQAAFDKTAGAVRKLVEKLKP